MSLIFIPGKVMEQFILDVISKNVDEKKVVKSNWVHQGVIMLDQSDSLSMVG